MAPQLSDSRPLTGTSGMAQGPAPARLPRVLADLAPAMKSLTWEDWAPRALALLKSPDSDVLLADPEDLADVRDGCLRIVSDIDRLAVAPDDEGMPDGGLFFALCDELRVDVFAQSVPGVPDDLPPDEIPWTAGLYRALVAELGCEDVLPTVRLRAAWRARFYEAGAAIRAEVPPPIDGALPSAPEEVPLTLAEASVALGIHPKTTERYLRSGELRAGRVGRRWRIPRSSVDAFLRSASAKER